MSSEQEPSAYEASLDPRGRGAVHELTALVVQAYPEASFAISPGADDPEATHIIATVDVDDPDEVVDLVIDRMLAIQIDEGLSVHLIPIRTPERTASYRRPASATGRSAALLPSRPL